MLRISTDTERPNFTFLEQFQDKLDSNAMYVPSWTSALGHLYLTISESKFTTENNDMVVVIPTDPGTTPTAPLAIKRPAIRSALATAVTANHPVLVSATSPTDPFNAEEAIRVHQQNQVAYITYVIARTALQSIIIKVDYQ